MATKQSTGIIRAGDVVLNLAMCSAFHRDGEKLFVHYAGGRIWSFTGKQADAIWAVASTFAGSDLLDEKTTELAAAH